MKMENWNGEVFSQSSPSQGLNEEKIFYTL
jgi:hypothetical protein